MLLRKIIPILCLLTVPPVIALSLEYQVKAAYLFNFIKFVEWPWPKMDVDSETTLKIAVLGGDPFEGVLSKLEKEKVGNRKIKVDYVRSPEGLQNYQVVFFPAELDMDVSHALSKLKKKPVLTVSDGNRFLKQGGILKLFLQDGKVRFSVHLSNAKSAGLYIDSELLNLAAEVIRTHKDNR